MVSVVETKVQTAGESKSKLRRQQKNPSRESFTFNHRRCSMEGCMIFFVNLWSAIPISCQLSMLLPFFGYFTQFLGCLFLSNCFHLSVSNLPFPHGRASTWPSDQGEWRYARRRSGLTQICHTSRRVLLASHRWLLPDLFILLALVAFASFCHRFPAILNC